MPDAVKINKFSQEQSNVLKFQLSKRRLSFCYQKEGCIFNSHLMEGKSEKCLDLYAVIRKVNFGSVFI